MHNTVNLQTTFCEASSKLYMFYSLFIDVDPCNNTGDRCIEWNNQNICLGDYYTGETCVHGYCRCVDNPNRDYCTCLCKCTLSRAMKIIIVDTSA